MPTSKFFNATTGDDNNTGTSSSPWRTWTKMRDAFQNEINLQAVVQTSGGPIHADSSLTMDMYNGTIGQGHCEILSDSSDLAKFWLSRRVAETWVSRSSEPAISDLWSIEHPYDGFDIYMDLRDIVDETNGIGIWYERVYSTADAMSTVGSFYMEWNGLTGASARWTVYINPLGGVNPNSLNIHTTRDLVSDFASIDHGIATLCDTWKFEGVAAYGAGKTKLTSGPSAGSLAGANYGIAILFGSGEADTIESRLGPKHLIGVTAQTNNASIVLKNVRVEQGSPGYEGTGGQTPIVSYITKNVSGVTLLWDSVRCDALEGVYGSADGSNTKRTTVHTQHTVPTVSGGDQFGRFASVRFRGCDFGDQRFVMGDASDSNIVEDTLAGDIGINGGATISATVRRCRTDWGNISALFGATVRGDNNYIYPQWEPTSQTTSTRFPNGTHIFDFCTYDMRGVTGGNTNSDLEASLFARREDHTLNLTMTNSIWIGSYGSVGLWGASMICHNLDDVSNILTLNNNVYHSSGDLVRNHTIGGVTADRPVSEFDSNAIIETDINLDVTQGTAEISPTSVAVGAASSSFSERYDINNDLYQERSTIGAHGSGELYSPSGLLPIGNIDGAYLTQFGINPQL